MTIDTRGLHVDKVYTKEERNKLEPQLDKLTDKDIKKLARFINRDIGNANTAYLRKLYLNESKERNGKHLIDDLISKLPEDKKSILEKKGFVKNDKLKHPETGSKQVAVIQSVLGVEVDGKYGPKTFKAVIEFQKSHGLKIDAIVGEETLNVMIAELGGKEKKADNKVDNSGKQVDKKQDSPKTGGNVIPGTVDISGKNKADKKENDSKAKTDNKTTKPDYQGDSGNTCEVDNPDYNGGNGSENGETTEGKESNKERQTILNADREIDRQIIKARESGQFNLNLGFYDNAIKNFNEALQLTDNPNKQVDLYLLIVKAYLGKGEKENAIATLESVLNIDGISNEKRQKISVIIKKFKNKEQTEETTEQAIKDISETVGQVIKVAPGMPNMVGGTENDKTTKGKENSDKNIGSLIEKGDELFKEKKYNEAIKKYINVLETNNKLNDRQKAEINNKLGICYLKIGEKRTAIEYFARVLESGLNISKQYIVEMYNNLFDGKISNFKKNDDTVTIGEGRGIKVLTWKELVKLINIKSKTEGVETNNKSDLLWKQGVEFYNLGEYVEAIKSFREALKAEKDPEEKSNIYNWIASTYLKIGGYYQVVKECDAGLKLSKDPNNKFKLYFLKAQAYHESGSEETAISVLKDALNIKGVKEEDRNVVKGIIKKFENKEQTEETTDEKGIDKGVPVMGNADRLLEIEKNKIKVLEDKYNIKIEKTDEGMYIVNDKEGKFLRNFDNINKIDEGISKVLLDKYEQLGDSLQSEGKIYEAIAVYKTALKYSKADKDKIGLNAIIGDLYYSKGDYKYAIGAYKEALKLSPNNGDIEKQLVESYVKLGAGYVESKQYENAEYAYNQALKYVKDKNEKKKIEGYVNRVKIAETAKKAYNEIMTGKKQ